MSGTFPAAVPPPNFGDPPPARTGLLKDVRRLGVHSGIYTISNLLTRGINFALLLLYTRVMSAEDYGVLALTIMVGTFLSVLLGVTLDSALTQMYYKYPSSEERRSLIGTLLVFMLVASAAVAFGIDLLGQTGLFDIIPHVPFRPYLRLTLWASYSGIFMTALQAIYMISQRPWAFFFLSVAHAALTFGLSLYWVVGLNRGVFGSLLAGLVASGSIGAISIALIARNASRQLSGRMLKEALSFSIPLVPHMASHWALTQSDRYVLGRSVSSVQVGIYSVGYQFSLPISLFISSVSNAFFPLVNARLSTEGNRHGVPALGTYALMSFTAASLGLSLLAEDAIGLLTPPLYHAASAVVPWVVLGCYFQGVNTIWSRGTWFSMKTAWIPVLTILAAALNIGLNSWLVPRWGIQAAAINTAVAYAVLALLQGWLAGRTYPIPWEYARWLKLMAAGGACFALGQWLSGDRREVNILVKLLITLVLFPLLLQMIRFFTDAEKAFIRSIPERMRSGLGAPSGDSR